MPIACEFQDGLLLLTISGDYPLRELVDGIISAYSNPKFTTSTSVLMDARQSTANRSSEDVWLSSQKLVGQQPAGYVGKWAIVVGDGPFRFALGRMGALTMESMGVPMAAFTDVNAALEYLRAPSC